MTGPVADTTAMIASMAPALVAGEVVFVTVPSPAAIVRLVPHARAMIREAEGVSLLLPLDVAAAAGFDTALPMVQITLTVWSALDGVGLTAAVAGALAARGIPANMIAGYHHDHVFVPAAQAEAAVDALRALASAASAATGPSPGGAT